MLILKHSLRSFLRSRWSLRCGHSARKKQATNVACFFKKTGNVLLSQAAARQVSSALGSLTAVFEMGTGVPSPLLSPDFSLPVICPPCCAAAFLRLVYVPSVHALAVIGCLTPCHADPSADILFLRIPSILNNVYPTYTLLETTGQVLDLLVPVSSACCHASTSGLSTW